MRQMRILEEDVRRKRLKLVPAQIQIPEFR